MRRKCRTQDKGHRAEIAAFVDAVARGELPVSLDELANVSTAAIAVVESLELGRPVHL